MPGEPRTPPHSVEAEQSVLGGLMLDAVAWDSVGDVLRAEDFYRPDHRLIFESIGLLAGWAVAREPLQRFFRRVAAYAENRLSAKTAGSVFGLRVTAEDMEAATTPTTWTGITDKPTVIAAGADAAAARAAIGAADASEVGDIAAALAVING